MNRLSTKAQSLCHVRISQPGRLVSLSTRGSPIRPTLHHTFPGRRNASTHASHDLPAHRTPEGNRSLMHGVFWSVGLATTIGVGYAATRSGGRINGRFDSRNQSLQSEKWFAEGTENVDLR